MKLLAMLSLALFSFVHNETYTLGNYSCENNQIRIQYEENWYNFSLFNIIVEDNKDICPYLKGEIQVEFEPLIKSEEPYQGYLFVNQELLQTTLVEDKMASVKIENPRYKYKIEKEKKQVLSDNVKTKKRTYSLWSRNIAIILIVLWNLLCLFLILRKKRSIVQKNTKKEENVV